MSSHINAIDFRSLTSNCFNIKRLEEGKESRDKIIIKYKTAISEDEGSNLEYVLKER